jgi:hypothetical protein
VKNSSMLIGYVLSCFAKIETNKLDILATKSARALHSTRMASTELVISCTVIPRDCTFLMAALRPIVSGLNFLYSVVRCALNSG